MAGLVGCSKSKERTSSKPVTQSWVPKAQWCAWRGNKRATVAQIAGRNLMPAMIETHSAYQVAVYGIAQLQTGQSWPQFPTECGYNGHLSIRTRPWSSGQDQRHLVWRLTFSFTSCGWLDVCVHYWPGEEMVPGCTIEKTSWRRQWNALHSLLLGKSGSWHSCECFFLFETLQLPKHCCRPSSPLMVAVFPNSSDLYQ